MSEINMTFELIQAFSVDFLGDFDHCLKQNLKSNVFPIHTLWENSCSLSISMPLSLLHLSLFEDCISWTFGHNWKKIQRNAFGQKENLLALIKWQDWIQGPENIIRTWFLSISLLCLLSHWLEFPTSHGSKRLPRARTSEHSQFQG